MSTNFLRLPLLGNEDPFPSPCVWAGLSDLLLTNRLWQGKNANPAMEKSGRRPLNQPIKVKNSSDVDITYQ